MEHKNVSHSESHHRFITTLGESSKVATRDQNLCQPRVCIKICKYHLF